MKTNNLQQNSEKSLVITGGHHTSALPVIKALSEHTSDIKIHWVGHKHSVKGNQNTTLEFREITELGIPFYDLQAGKFYKTFNPISLAKIPYGFFQALILLKKIKPRLIVSFGGYLAVPVVLAGKVLGIPAITHEQTVVAGYANKLIAKLVDKIMISWPQSAKYFPKHKTVLTGIPIRGDIYKAKSTSFEVNKELPTIYITAGKTGSVKINEAILSILPELLTVANVIHQCGDNSFRDDEVVLTAKWEALKHKVPGNYYVRKFVMEDEIGEAFTKANIVLSRSGAHTTAELLLLEKPCILIPIPWVSHNEQYENAKVLKDAGLGTIYAEQDLANTKKLYEFITSTLNDLSLYKIKNPEIKKLVTTDAADLILTVIKAYF